MTFTKNKISFMAIIFILVVVYNVVVFVIPFYRGGGFWIGYGFAMLAMFLTLGMGLFVLDQKELKSKFYGMPLIILIWIYLIIQLVLSLVEMGLGFIPAMFQIGLVLNTVLLGACLLGLIAVNATKDTIERTDEVIKEKVFYIKSLQADIEGLVDKAEDESVKKGLKELAETIRYSDPMSNPQLAVIENKIEVKAAVLGEAVKGTDVNAMKELCAELQQLFAERNRKCKVLK